MDTTINATAAQTTAQTAAQNAAQTTAAQPTQNKVTAKVTAVYFTKYEDNSYYTITFRLNKALKVMKEGDDGLYKEDTTLFLSKPAAALLQDLSDDVANYYLATQSVTQQTLSTALSGAEVAVRQKFFAAGEAADGVANETDHDQWFSFIDKLTVSKMGKLVMSKQLGLSIDELKLLLEE